MLTKTQIQSVAARLGAEITARHPDGVTLVAVLKGSVPFFSDVVRQVDAPCTLEFLAISKFAADSGRVQVVMDIGSDLAGRDVVLVEDVADTGLSLTYLQQHLRSKGPAVLETCVLIDKAARRIVPVELDYVGLRRDDEFVIGYGLDFKERYRNLPELFVGDRDTLQKDADAYVKTLYRG